MKFIDFIIIGILFVGLYYEGEENNKEIIEAINKPKFEYDYMIDLQNHDGCYSIHILDEYDHMHVINPDSLEEFIEKDNL